MSISRSYYLTLRGKSDSRAIIFRFSEEALWVSISSSTITFVSFSIQILINLEQCILQEYEDDMWVAIVIAEGL